MSVKSACSGSATWDAATITDVRNITVTTEAEVKEYASSSTSCTRKRITGTTLTTFTFTVYAASPTELLFAVGDTGALILKSTTADTLFSGNAVIESIEFEAGVEAGDLVGATINGSEST